LWNVIDLFLLFVENLVGQGGYSDVYRGDLEDGRRIAVKRLAKDSNNMNKEKEFLMELGVISHVNHPNTASLVGYCIENGFYLIFKFYPNGTLSSALHGMPFNLIYSFHFISVDRFCS